MHKPDGCCKKLIEETAGALNYDVVTLMLVVVQRSNVELSVKLAVKRCVCSYKNGEVLVIFSQYSTCPHLGSNAEDIAKKCLEPFPYIWVSGNACSFVPGPADAACLLLTSL